MPLSGPLEAGETSTVELRLDGPVTSLATLTGPHNLSIDGDAPWTWEYAAFEISRTASGHNVEIILPR